MTMNNERQYIDNQNVQSGREVTVHNPDAFDVGQSVQEYNQRPQIREDPVTQIINNPARTIQAFDLTEEQLENIIAGIAGIGAGIGSGLTTKHLSRAFGHEFAAALGGALGGLLGGYTGKRLIRGRRSRSRFIE